MVGNPKYQLGDKVKFKCDNDIKEGYIAIVDKYGTFFNDKDASYDILNKDEKMLYKHFTESLILEKIGSIDPKEIWK